MAETPVPTLEPAKPILDVAIIAGLTVAANKLLPPDQRETATTSIPFIGGGIAWGIRWLRKRLAYRRLVELEKGWLAEAIRERNKPGLPRAKCRELDADIARRKQLLEELQRENTRVQ